MQQFVNLARGDYKELFRFLTSKQIRIKNISAVTQAPLSPHLPSRLPMPSRGLTLLASMWPHPFVSTCAPQHMSAPHLCTSQAGFENDNVPDKEEELDHYAESLKRHRKESDISAAGFGGDDDNDDDESEDGDFAPKEESDVDEEYDEGSEDDDGHAGKLTSRSRKGGDDESESDSTEAPKKKAKTAAYKGKKLKAKQEANAPKRPTSSYMLWMNANRGRIKEENPGAEAKDIARLAGIKWKELDTEDQEVWKLRAKEDKVRYARELSIYSREHHGEAASDDKLGGDEDRDYDGLKDDD